MGHSSYKEAGVQDQAEALSAVERFLGPTFTNPERVEILTKFGHYASVLKITDRLALAFCTDGVGSKTMVASQLDRYDTIGFDCVAMNVNDIICVGARPVALVDYLGVNRLDPARTDAILKGLGDAASEAGIAIPGGEIAQLPDIIGSDGRGPGDETAFDLVAACIGVLDPSDLILGKSVSPGDAIIGVRSSGLHSNGYTLVRRVLLGDAGYSLHDELPVLGSTLGEELLRPTRIYVRAAAALWDAGIATSAIAHITGDGFLNLCRLEAPVGYLIDALPEPPKVFELIREAGDVSYAEMFRVFNMGVGLVVVVRRDVAETALDTLVDAGYEGSLIGTVSEETGVVEIPAYGLKGTAGKGEFEES